MPRPSIKVNPDRGLYIKEWRTTFGFSQKELARMLDVCTMSVVNWENAWTPVPTTVMYCLEYFETLTEDELSKLEENNEREKY